VLAVLFGAGILTIILYAVVVVAAGAFHADFTDTLLWAEASWRRGGCLIPDSTMQPLCLSADNG
jgi:hypothetical protein